MRGLNPLLIGQNSYNSTRPGEVIGSGLLFMTRIYDDKQTTITTLDQPTHGANHRYVVQSSQDVLNYISFQCGPVKEVGYNGVQNEHLLRIVQHRLQCFQDGPYACPENQEALKAVTEAISHCDRRTKNRIQRNVEGTSQL